MIMPSALVLAGSRPGAPDPVAQAEGVAHKALALVGGEPMLSRVLRALRAAGVEYIMVATDEPELVGLALAFSAQPIKPGAGPSASVAEGFRVAGAPLLVTTSDHALLKPEWVRDFVSDTPADADVSVLLARRDTVEAALPETRRTYLRFADGQWSGCNLFLLNTPYAVSAIRLWETVEAERKQPWKIAARLGPRILLSFLFGRLSLAAAIARLGEKVGLDAAAVAARDGLAAVDVDKPSDLVQVRNLTDRGT